MGWGFQVNSIKEDRKKVKWEGINGHTPSVLHPSLSSAWNADAVLKGVATL